MFDTKQPFKLTIVSGTEKSCEVRFPTDKEWCARSRRQRVIIRDIGRGKTHRDVPKRELIDQELFQAIAGTETVTGFDEYEAARIIERLARAEIVSAVRDGDRFLITLRVFGNAEVTHSLKIPTLKDHGEFGNAAVDVKDSRRQREISVALEPSAELWNRLKIETEGYADPDAVPVIHKDAALVELFAQFQELQDPEV